MSDDPVRHLAATYSRGYDDGYEQARQDVAAMLSEHGQRALVGLIAALIAPLASPAQPDPGASS